MILPSMMSSLPLGTSCHGGQIALKLKIIEIISLVLLEGFPTVRALILLKSDSHHMQLSIFGTMKDINPILILSYSVVNIYSKSAITLLRLYLSRLYA